MPFGVLTACRGKVTLFCNAFAQVRLHSVLMERKISRCAATCIARGCVFVNSPLSARVCQIEQQASAAAEGTLLP
jgi:hypothetical protein